MLWAFEVICIFAIFYSFLCRTPNSISLVCLAKFCKKCQMLCKAKRQKFLTRREIEGRREEEGREGGEKREREREREWEVATNRTFITMIVLLITLVWFLVDSYFLFGLESFAQFWLLFWNEMRRATLHQTIFWMAWFYFIKFRPFEEKSGYKLFEELIKMT